MNRLGKLLVGLSGGLFVLLGLGTSTPKADAAVTGPNPSIERVTAQTPLYLTTAANVNGVGILQDHESHYSHSSHGSHSSHDSHYSHRSGS